MTWHLYHPDFERYDLSSVSFIMSGAAPLGDGLTKKVLNRFLLARGLPSLDNPTTTSIESLRIIQAYGLTETSPTTHYLPPPHSLRKIGSIGTPLPHLQQRPDQDDTRREDQVRLQGLVRPDHPQHGHLHGVWPHAHG